MRVVLALVVVLAAVVAPCASAWKKLGTRWPGRTITYANLSPGYAWSLQQAIDGWNASGARVRFVPEPRARAQVLVSAKLRPGMAGEAGEADVRSTHDGWSVDAIVRIEDGMDRYAAAQVYAHELGHVLGLAHEDRGCSSMNPALAVDHRFSAGRPAPECGAADSSRATTRRAPCTSTAARPGHPHASSAASDSVPEVVMSKVAVSELTIETVRARFTALQQPLAFFDGPGGTQVPDSVIDAIGGYLREANANTGGPFSTSHATDALVAHARQTAADFLGATYDEVAFGANMTTLNFALSRAASREWKAGDEVICTKLDHDANVSPWLELARDRELTVHFCEVDDECQLDLDHLRSLLSERTRVVAFPYASNAVGTVTPVTEIAALARDADALAWVDAVHYAPHGPIDVAALGADVLLCSPYKYYGPHLGLAFARRELLESWRPYKVRPADDTPVGHRYETGTLAHELLAGFVAAVGYLGDVGWDFVHEHEHELGVRFLDGLPRTWTLHGVPTMEGRVPTFAITHATVSPETVATRLGEQGFAVWHGNYYAVEIMERLGLPDGAVRVGIVHYNTAGEIDRLLTALAAL